MISSSGGLRSVYFLWKTGTKPNKSRLQPEGIRKVKGEDKEKITEPVL